MSVSYKAVGWNKFKRSYDIALLLGVLVFVAAFIGISLAIHPQASVPIMLIRAFGTGAFVLLHFILIIGPLARLDKRWLPVLYNRRHLGVTMFLMALVHAGIIMIMHHGGAATNPITSIILTDAGFSMDAFPFQAFGLVALLIFFMMAATSHDFWLANLTAPVWKTLHMGVYIAYGLTIIHVAFGILQTEQNPIYTGLVGLGFVLVSGLHLLAGFKQKGIDEELSTDDPTEDGYIKVCRVDEVPTDAAKGVVVSGERVAVVNWEGKLSAVSGVCQHQNGPLAEGKFVYGCLTCPWHGYQYKCDNGKSPEPFTEEIPTFNIRVFEDEVYINPKPNPAGTFVEPVIL